ncbi:dihydrofolate reductase [Gryllotalpicola reticulitermitis]|uniref:Dihydrofolate reductase n=1 Tax=Gryllotalpicola reticulitermitis TaxID=1184153 RepID=A0ABV8QAE9_9MICO
MPAPLALIWAQTTTGVIGGNGDIPWQIPGEQRRFKEFTTGGTVIMGRKTWESLPERVRPMPGRDNIIVTRSSGFLAPGALVVHSVAAALGAADPAKQAWCMGGGELYAQTIAYASRLEVTEVDLDVPGDAFAPLIGQDWRQASADPPEGWHTSPAGLRYRFLTYLR